MKKVSKIFVGLNLLITGLVFVATETPAPQAQPTEDMDMIMLKPEDRRVVAEGAPLYQQHCAACHGVELEGQPDWRTPKDDGTLWAPPHDASGHTWHHPDRWLVQIVTMGRVKYSAEVMNRSDIRSDMPGFEGQLTDEEIIAVLSYIKSTWPPHIVVQHDLVNRGIHPQH